LDTLLREPLSDGFRDLAGAEATLTLPIADTLLTRLIAQRIPPTASIRRFDLFAEPGERLVVQVQLAKLPEFLPPIRVGLQIEQQPALPASPIITLALQSPAMATLAAGAFRFVDILPAGVRFADNRFIIDLASLLEQQRAGWVLSHLTHLHITTRAGAVVVHARGGLPGQR
jgi:hypothetical protein